MVGTGALAAIRRSRTVFLGLKVASLGLLSIYSFEIIYVLVRSVPPGFYPWMVLLTSIGNYVLAMDLGFSAYIYAVVRRGFLDGREQAAARVVSEAAAFYLLIAGAATVVAAVVIALVVPAGLRLSLIGYFASIVLPLPWMLVRRAGAAIDLFFEIETIELVRRGAMCLLAACMLFGLSLGGFALASLTCWALAAAGASAAMRASGFALRLDGLSRLPRFLMEHREGVFKSGRFTIIEFGIYNYPYIAIPLIYHGPLHLVAFDLFNKVTRFGGAAYSVPSEVFCPPQTRAYYRGDAEGVRHYQRLTWAVGALPMAAGAALLLFYGGPLFGHLVADMQAVAPLVRVAMAGMLLMLLVQSSAGGLLVSVGRYDAISSIAMATAALMAAAVAVTVAAGLDFPTFMILYVLVYSFHAIAFHISFARDMAGRAIRTGTPATVEGA